MAANELALVRIHWSDASHRQGWYSSSEVAAFVSSEYVIESVGWLADETDSHLAIAQSRSLHRFGDVVEMEPLFLRPLTAVGRSFTM